MRGGSRGWWSAEIELPPGRHTYRYMVDGCYGIPDYGAGDPVYDANGNLVTRLVLGGGNAAPPPRQREGSAPRRGVEGRGAVNKFLPGAR
jgi:hypothetical protein